MRTMRGGATGGWLRALVVGLTVGLAACDGGEMRVPEAPTGVRLEIGDGRVTVLWDGSQDPEVKGYHVYAGETLGEPVAVPSPSTLYMVTGLKNGTAYRFAVSAVSKQGLESPRSAEVAGTPRALDTRRPVLLESLPVSGSVAVPRESALTLTFSRPVLPASLRVDVSPQVALAPPVWEEGNTRVRLAPAAPLAWRTEYTAQVSVSDAQGLPLEGESLVRFTTVPSPDTTPPTLVASSPAAAATGVLETAALTLTFSEPVEPYTLTLALSPEAPLGTPVWSEGNTRVTVTPAAPLRQETAYALTGQVRDAAQNALALRLAFTTRLPPDTVAPILQASVPAAGTPAHPVDAPVRLVFSEPMDRLRTEAAVRLQPYAPVTFAWSPDGRTLEVAPQAPLAWETDYTLTVSAVAADLVGNVLPATPPLTFRTARMPDRTPPEWLAQAPAAGAIGVARSTDVQLFFSEPMDVVSTHQALRVARGTHLGERVAGDVAWADGGRRLVFRPHAPFEHGEEVHVSVEGGADAAGNPLTPGAPRVFRTMRMDTLKLTASHDAWAARSADGRGFDWRDTDVELTVGAASYVFAGTWHHRAFVTFDFRPLVERGATRVTSATFYAVQKRLDGNPYSAKLLLQAVEYDTPLDPAAFEREAEASWVLSDDPHAVELGALVTGVVARDYAAREAGAGRTQFRLAFSAPLSGYNLASFGSRTSSWEYNRPALHVQFELP
jgi:methionine-rich copper-binding protein CopC